MATGTHARRRQQEGKPPLGDRGGPAAARAYPAGAGPGTWWFRVVAAPYRAWVALARLAKLPAGFDALATALAVLNVGQVYLTEYPTGLFDDIHGAPVRGCELFSGPQLDLSLRDAELVKEIAEKLNQAISEAADKHHWIYVTGIAAAFRGHGYCTPDGHRYFWQCSESLATQGDTEGTVHPNDLGHRAIGQEVAASALKNTIRPGRPDQVHADVGHMFDATVGAAPGAAGHPGRSA